MLTNIYNNTLEILQELSEIKIARGGEVINILSTLKQLPRTGKSVRIDKYNLNLPKQSLYDHVLELAFIFDAASSLFQYKFDRQLLAEMCAFHDLSEVIIGDVPFFTTEKLAGTNYLTKDEKNKKENEANAIISNLLPEKLATPFKNTISILGNEFAPNSEIVSFFWLVDKIEPIISVWRYVHAHRSKLDLQNFLIAMTDFFINPNVAKYAINKDFGDLISFLQDKTKLELYYSNKEAAFNGLEDQKKEFLKMVIEGNEMLYIV